MNFIQKTKTRRPVWVLLLFISIFSACGTLKSIKEAAKGLKTTLKKTDTLLDKADTATIEPFTHKAARGFIAGANLDSIKVNGFVDNLLKELDRTLSRELNELKLEGLDGKLNKQLRGVLENDTLRQRFKNLLTSLITDLEKKKIKLNLDVNLNEEQMVKVLNRIKSGLLTDSTSSELAALLDKSLSGVAEGPGLNRLLDKIKTSVKDIDQKLAEQNKSWRKFLTKLGIIVGALLLLGIFFVAYFFRKKSQYKKLATILTKGIDQIADRQDYDHILTLINGQVEVQQVHKQLLGILHKHKDEYSGKKRYANYTDRTIQLFCDAMKCNQEIRDQIMAKVKSEPELMRFVKNKLN